MEIIYLKEYEEKHCDLDSSNTLDMGNIYDKLYN